MAACCPPDSIGKSSLSQVIPKGKTVQLSNDMPCYQVGSENPSRVVLVFSDVYGIDSGHHKAFCDVLQTKLGNSTAVWMPDLFRGHPIMGSWNLSPYWTRKLSYFSIIWECRTRITETNVERDLVKVVQPALPTPNFACVGFCFGGWVIAKCLQLQQQFKTKACVGIHPSWRIEAIFGKRETDLAQSTGTAPILLLPAKNDSLKVGSEPVSILAQNRSIPESDVAVEFPTMLHGWVTRGDVKDDSIREAQAKAIDLTASFVAKHLQEEEE